MTDDLTAAYAEVLAEHPFVRDRSWEADMGWCGCGNAYGTVPRSEHDAHVAAALVASPATKAHEAAERAKARRGRCGCAWCCAGTPPEQRGEAHQRTCHPATVRAAATEETQP